MKIIKEYLINKFVVYSLILLLIVLFSVVPIGNRNFDIEIVNDDERYEENIVYLLDDDMYVSRVISYFNTDNILDEIRSKINVLINGDNTLKSFYSLIPKGTILKNVKVERDNVYLDFNKDLLNVNLYVEESMIEAIIYTLTEINGINNIYIMVDGKLLTEYPNSKKEIKYPLTRKYGINKEYNLDSLNDIDKTTIFFAKSNNDEIYYVPVTKISNIKKDKIDIIFDELKSSVNSQNHLDSYISNNVQLVGSSIDNNKMNLVFNENIFNDSVNKTISKEVKFLISQSIFENYDINEITFSTKNYVNIDTILKNNK